MFSPSRRILKPSTNSSRCSAKFLRISIDISEVPYESSTLLALYCKVESLHSSACKFVIMLHLAEGSKLVLLYNLVFGWGCWYTNISQLDISVLRNCYDFEKSEHLKIFFRNFSNISSNYKFSKFYIVKMDIWGQRKF